MTTQEHLNRIKAKCQELLAIAEKRTAGRWSVEPFGNWEEYKIDPHIFSGEPAEATGMTLSDAAFIASCAGAAEAGWRATVAAIDICLDYDIGALEILAEEIIAAWPQELL